LKMLKYQPVIQMYSKLLDKPENRAQDREVPHLSSGSDTAITEPVMDRVNVGQT